VSAISKDKKAMQEYNHITKERTGLESELLNRKRRVVKKELEAIKRSYTESKDEHDKLNADKIKELDI